MPKQWPRYWRRHPTTTHELPMTSTGATTSRYDWEFYLPKEPQTNGLGKERIFLYLGN